MFVFFLDLILAIHVTLTAQETIDETAGALKVDLTLDKPSPCCLHVYVKAEEESATGKLHVLCVCVCVWVRGCVHACM